jgi:hypothetical protein
MQAASGAVDFRAMGRRPRVAATRLAGAVALAIGVGGCGGVEPTTGYPASTTLATGSETGCPSATDTGSVDTTACGSTTSSCIPGQVGCPCTEGGSCDDGLMCISEICVSMGCPVGSDGCPCTPGGGCDPELVCMSELCVPN